MKDYFKKFKASEALADAGSTGVKIGALFMLGCFCVSQVASGFADYFKNKLKKQ